MDNFRVITISYQTAPLHVRELVAMDNVLIGTFLNNIKNTFQLEDILLVSTCNRTEIYYRSEIKLNQQLIAYLCSLKGLDLKEITPFFKFLAGFDAVQHLYKVSLGLDSMVLGDIQIINQIKSAYQLSADLNTCTSFLHRLLHAVFHSNKRVANETHFKDGNASLASVSVELTKKFLKNKVKPKIAIVGLGEIGSNVACNLKDYEAEITLFNRTKSKTISLAHEYNFLAGDMDELYTHIQDVDVIITAVQSDNYLFHKTHFENKTNPSLIIDLGVPRNVPSTIEECEAVTLLNVDHLNERVQSALAMRKAQVPSVIKIINESICEFAQWSKEVHVFPVIQQLKAALEDIRKQELARYIGKLDEQQSAIIESVTNGMIQKIVKMPVLELKASCQRGDSEKLVDVLQELFNLEKTVA